MFDPLRTEETKTLNSKLKIECLQTYPESQSKYKSYDCGLFVDGLGFVSFDGVEPYCPCGGANALSDILQAGGFIDYKNISFVGVE